jgi:hypothetical protein
MRPAEERVVLAIYPSTRGLGFVLLSGPEFLADWGTKEIRWKDKNFLAMHRVKTLIERYQPEVIVLEDTKLDKYKRHTRIVKLHQLLVTYAEKKKILVRSIQRRKVRAYFGSGTKYATAEAVARFVPSLAPHMPRKRGTGDAENLTQSLFDAAALGLVYFAGLKGAESR